MTAPQDAFMPSGGSVSGSSAAYVVPVARARFVFRTRFFDPVSQSDQPLPLHQFYIFAKSPRLSVLGEPSQADGCSWINFTDDGEEEMAGTEWALAWRPLVTGPDGKLRHGPDVGSGEAWLDLDAMAWIARRDIQLTDRRRLLRLPLWASFMKAKQGGFVDGPNSGRFRSTGILVYDEGDLGAYGTPSKPWSVAVDHGLFRSYVRFSYYDFKDKQRKPVPPGLVVQAVGRPALSKAPIGNDSRLAGGTAIDDSGTVYLLHEHTKAHLSNFDYLFFTGKQGESARAIIDFTTPPGRDRVRVSSSAPGTNRSERYVLPREWHSKGMQSWTEEDGHGFPQRKPFASLRKADTTRKKPLQFHLDDAVLVRGDAPATVNKGARITLFDSLLHIRDADPKRPHLWKTPLASNYLPAEDAVVVQGEGVERATRIIFEDGAVYDLREKRLEAVDGASFGNTSCLGARAAIFEDYDPLHQRVSYMAGVPSMPEFLGQIGRSNFHLIDVSNDVKHTVDGKDVKLLHLLVWVPVRWDGTKAGTSIDHLFPLLTAAAVRWDQTHPGHPGDPGPGRRPAEFVLAPEGVVTANERVVRVRHFFAETRDTYPDVVTLKVLPESPKARAGASGVGKLVTLFLGDIGPRPHPKRDAEPEQNEMTNRFTLAHELGHIMGWPDEYIEDHATLGGYPSWNQYPIAKTAARPFATDAPGIMRSNNKPRLRQYWHYADRIKNEPALKAMIETRPYLPINLAPATGGKIVLESPHCGDALLEQNSYEPVFSGFIPDPSTRRCDACLYRIRTDEGAVERMFKKTTDEINTASVRPFDGLLIIRIKLMLHFDPAINKDNILRTFVLDTLHEMCQANNVHTTQFAIVMEPSVSPAGRSHDKPWLRRVFVCFHSELDRANDYLDAKPPRPVPGDAHLTLRIVPSRTTPNPLLSSSASAQLELMPSEIDESLLIHALGQKTFFADPTTGNPTLRQTIDHRDIQFLAKKLSTLLQDAPPHGRRAVAT